MDICSARDIVPDQFIYSLCPLNVLVAAVMYNVYDITVTAARFCAEGHAIFSVQSTFNITHV